MAIELELIFIFSICSVAFCINNVHLYPFGDVRNCLAACANKSCSFNRMKALPGVGFDNLRNVEMSAVVQYNYSECKTTNDGLFLIPDDVMAIPIQQSRLDSYATIYDHWDNYVSMTSASINLGATIYSAVSGKFGFEYQHVKEHQVNNFAKTTRTQMRNTVYKVILEPDAQLHPKFKSRLLDIAANIQNNNTVYAAYLCELLVRDYGTHVLRSIDAGAVVSQIDSISAKYVSDKKGSRFNITSAAAASFKGKFAFSFSAGVQNGHTNLDEYTENRYYSQVMSIGGPLVHPNMTLDEWEAGVLQTLVAIDRSGDPLHFLISPNSVPELPSPTIRELVEYVYKGVEMYYSVNTHHGCTDPTSPNFNYEANLDDNSCESPQTNYTFGGVYQTCSPVKGHDKENLCDKGYNTKNPLTGNYSCPEGFVPHKLHSGTVTRSTKEKICDKVCHKSGFFGLSKKCKCLTAWVNILISAKYDAYWCVAEDSEEISGGALFGGLYTSKNMNPVTRSMTCPFHFYPLHIGRDLKICVSTQYENAFKYSIPFGGFISCKSGNPLATDDMSSDTYPKQCPNTYKKFLASIDDGCEINYCAQMQSDYAIKPPKLPPFHSKPGLKVNLTQSMVIQGPYGELWVRNDDGGWIKASTGNDDLTGEEVLQHFYSRSDTLTVPSASGTDDESSSKKLSSSAIAIVVSTSVLALVLLVALVFFGIYLLRKYKKAGPIKRYVPSSVRISRAYSSIDGESINQDEINEKIIINDSADKID